MKEEELCKIEISAVHHFNIRLNHKFQFHQLHQKKRDKRDKTSKASKLNILMIEYKV